MLANEADVLYHALKVLDMGNVEYRMDSDTEVYKGQFTTAKLVKKSAW